MSERGEVRAYADGFGRWHAEVTLISPHAEHVQAQQIAETAVRGELTERATAGDVPVFTLEMLTWSNDRGRQTYHFAEQITDTFVPAE